MAGALIVDRERAAQLLAKQAEQEAAHQKERDLLARYGQNRAGRRRAARELRNTNRTEPNHGKKKRKRKRK